MSGLAKAFVVINLVLTLFFLGAVATLYQTNKNWKGVAEKGAEALVELKDHAQARTEADAGRIQALSENNSRLDSEIAVLSTQKQELENEVGTLRTDKTNLTTQVNTQQQQIASKDQHLQDKDTELARKDEEIARLIDEKNKADQAKTEAITLAQRARLDLQQQTDSNEALSIELAAARRDLDDKTLAIATFRERFGASVDELTMVQPKIDAVVVAVQDGIVILSVGRDDNVKQGYEFTVFANDRFIGKVKVETLLEDMSGAKILFTEEGQSIQAGQQATTRLAGA